MPRKFKFCLHCRRTITEKEVQRGLFVQTPQGMLCTTCAQLLDEETEAAKKLAAAQPVSAESLAPTVEEKPEPVPPARQAGKPPEPPKKPPAPEPPATPHAEAPPGPQPIGSEQPVQLLDGIRQHLEAIHRTLTFEKSSPWNVLATVAQCLAVGMLIISAVNWAYNPIHLLLVALIFQVMALTFFVRGK